MRRSSGRQRSRCGLKTGQTLCKMRIEYNLAHKEGFVDVNLRDKLLSLLTGSVEGCVSVQDWYGSCTGCV